MKASIQLEISYDQILSLVKKLPIQEKIKLSQELEKEAIESKLSKLLKTFRTKDLSLDEINEEVEKVRQQIYEEKR